ncbi:MAG: hypothetical protein AABX10_04980 [Nanoarchaeota archaeon]
MNKTLIISSTIIITLLVLYFTFNLSEQYSENELNMSWINNELIYSEVIKVRECEYNSEKVYYFVNPECCDFINELYNSKGEIICSFGGIAGLNTCPDFDSSSCKRDVWNIPNNDDLTKCIKWKDDCNTCSKSLYSLENLTSCTEMACSERTGIKCLEYKPESNATYETFQEYYSSIDFSCNTDSDCEIKDIHNCCGYYPGCANKNAKTDPDFVRKFCSENGFSSVCGWPSIQSCKCVSNKCESDS